MGTNTDRIGAYLHADTEWRSQINLAKAINYYQEALKVLTRAEFPDEWARVQVNLGNAYLHLPSEDRQADLKAAIEYYHLALQIRKR